MPHSRLPPKTESAGPATAGRRFDPGGALPPSPAPHRVSPASGRPASRAGRPDSLPRPDPGSWPDPDTPRSRRRPEPGPQPAERAWSCRWSHRRAGRWSRRAADLPTQGSRQGRESRSISLDPTQPAARSARPAGCSEGLPGRRLDSVAALLPGRPRPRCAQAGRLRPSAELPHPSAPGGTLEQPRRSEEGLSWDAE
jgi:hypothetical protein